MLNKSIFGIEALEERLRRILGHEGKMPWLYIKEVLTCHLVHGIPFPDGITAQDEQDTTSINSWMWGRMFNVRNFIMGCLQMQIMQLGRLNSRFSLHF